MGTDLRVAVAIDDRKLSECGKDHRIDPLRPRSIDFEVELPRLPTGKLYKRLLRDRYLKDQGSRPDRPIHRAP